MRRILRGPLAAALWLLALGPVMAQQAIPDPDTQPSGPVYPQHSEPGYGGPISEPEYNGSGVYCDDDCHANCNGNGRGRGSLIARMRARRAHSECRDLTQYGDQDLFYNFWVGPTCGGVAADMYLAPHPVPANVGHTYYTYQPLMPHEMLYSHSRRYHHYYDDGRGLTRARVRWYKSPSYRVANLANYLKWPR